MSGDYRDKPLRFDWVALWRPEKSEQVDDLIRLSVRDRAVHAVRNHIIARLVIMARENPERWVSYSRRKEWYSDAGRRRYWPVRHMYSAVVSAVDQLARDELAENEVVSPGDLGVQSRMRATPKLMAMFEENRIVLVPDNREIILLRDEEGRLLDYNDTRAIARMRRALKEYNEAASSLDVRINGQKIIEGEPIALGKDKHGKDIVTGAAQLQGVRIFNGDHHHGGRIYGLSIQSAPKIARMDEKFEETVGKPPTKKCSFSARHLIDKLGPNPITDPQNGMGVVLGWAPGPPPGGSWLPWVLLAPGLASLAAVASFWRRFYRRL